MADSLKSLIDSLPDTADGIAAYLEGQGIKGLQGLSSMCPLAMLMKRHGFESPSVGKEIKSRQVENPECVEHTPATQTFVTRFDSGNYPQLDAMAPQKL